MAPALTQSLNGATPQVKAALHYLDANTVSIDDIIHYLKHHGGVVVQNLISEEILQEVGADIKPYFDALVEPGFFSSKTRIVTRLPNKSIAFVEKIFGNQVFQDVCDHFLTSHHRGWYGNEQYTYSPHPVFNSALAFSTLPGNETQSLHRECMGQHNKLPAIAPENYPIGRDTVLGMFVADTRTTRENGATRFIPGSHLQSTLDPPDESQTVPVEMNRGDVFLMLGSCYHGASANVSQAEERILYSTFMTQSTRRQEENIYLSVPVDRVRVFSPRMQKRLGFSASDPLFGWVDVKDPRKVFGLPGLSEGQHIDV
ncbi:hypothetical protein BO99DRAFT_449504 [Aspergillus violaceofuscus CBS 115571]|uniref:Phytanoyl-CoA dioxygenase family protein n=1 Tax=Aspergillus violaceofuscus (strain CBS 115571) TaxID=1450538 RepID=A0A2V5GTJ1_ASPV1|nr:hypothetical protein BO99DRAFT_449504 [Aspergillus violaceofuscus CBS 115571]